MENRRQKGSLYEQKVAQYLTDRGFRILEMNYRCRIGEIDIIAREAEYLVFIEVKYRKDTAKGLPQEAVNLRKQRVISKVADYYCMTKGVYGTCACRFDVAAVLGEEIRLIRNAFYYAG